LRAFARVRSIYYDTLLVIAGSGPLETSIQKWIRNLGLSGGVVMLGSVPYRSIPVIFAACDVFALSSVYEGNARVLAEAAAAGKPAVTTAVSGSRDTVVDGQTGFIVALGDDAAFAERIRVLLDSPTAAAQMGQNARRYILEAYNHERLLAGFSALWSATAAARPRRRP
jgi:glycosyltransferase involved in cell wall biosynthesis